MGNAYPELPAQKEIVSKVIREEEASFLRTLETGIQLLNKHIAQDLKEAGQKDSPEK